MDMLIGTKRGMTQMWSEQGDRIPVTVIDLGPNTITAVKTVERDGYEAVQLGFGSIRPKLMAKPQVGAFAAAGVEPQRHLREVRCEVGEAKLGDVISCAAFEPGTLVDVIGTSKGKGFQGTIKLHNFSRGPTSHGSQNVRRSGSIGMHQFPGRVLPGKKMAARMGGKRVTVKHLSVVSIDPEAHVMLVKGAVPGNNGGVVLVRKSVLQGKGSAS